MDALEIIENLDKSNNILKFQLSFDSLIPIKNITKQYLIDNSNKNIDIEDVKRLFKKNKDKKLGIIKYLKENNITDIITP